MIRGHTIKTDKTTLLALVAFFLFAAGYFPVFQLLAGKWLASDEYSHAFLTVPIILYMAWREKNALLESRAHYPLIGLALVVLATVFYLFSLRTKIDTLIIMSMGFTLASTLFYLFGLKAFASLFTPLLLLVLLIPAPVQLYAKLTSPLQLLVSKASAWLIMLFNIPVFREGNILHLPEKSFEVVEACSGLRSMITLITLSVIIGYFTLHSNFSKLTLLVVSVPTALFTNIVRVTSMVLLFHYAGLDMTEGTWHAAHGLLIFGIALTILFLLQKVLSTWEVREK